MPSEVVLPSPELHEDWRSFARALIAALEGSATMTAGQVTYIVTNSPVTPGQLPGWPAGFVPLWLDQTQADIYVGNADYDPPDAADLFAIDTANIALAAITAANIGPGAVETAKIKDLAVVTAKVANAAIVSALIGDLAVITAKINELAVNSAKIADLAVTSAKIANLAVGAAHIQALAVGEAHIQNASITDAKIGNVIQSSNWNEATKTGWKIDKTGLIQGQSIGIYDTNGSLVFGASGTIDFSRVLGIRPDLYNFDGNLWPNASLAVTSDGWSFSSVFNPYIFRQAVNLAATDPGPYWRFKAGEYRAAAGVGAGDANFAVAGNSSSISGATAQYYVTPGEKLYWELLVQLWNTLRLTRFNIRFFDALDNIISTEVVDITPAAANVWALKAGSVTVPPNAAKMHVWVFYQSSLATNVADEVRIAAPRVARTQSGATVGATIGVNLLGQMTSANIGTFIAGAAIGTALIANAAISTALIQDSAIVTAKIADLAVTSAKIVSLDANKINAASLSAITANIGLLRTASSGARLEIADNLIRVYDSNNVLRVRLGVW